MNNSMNTDKSVNSFLHKYEATAGLSYSKFYYKRQPIQYRPYGPAQTSAFDLAVEREQMVEMNMPQDKFQRLVDREEEFWDIVRGNERANDVVRRMTEEERIRAQNPAVKIAYERYLMLLEMVRK